MAMVTHSRHRPMMAFQGATPPATPQQTILTAAVAVPYYPVMQPPDTQPDRPIGYGAFGVVWAVTDPRDGKRVALKKMPNVFHNTISGKRVYRELKMLCHFKHDNVLSSLDILQPPQYDFFQEIYVVTELMQSDLHKIIVSPQPLTADHVKVFLYQILRALKTTWHSFEGLKYLHSARVLHRDIKPGNLLVNSNCCLKICDFGLARVEPPDQNLEMTSEVVTQYYRAPEILMGAKHYSSAVDMWSVGCIFAELLSRRILFQAQTPIQQLDLIMELTGTPTEEQMTFACEGARAHVMRQPLKQPRMHILYNISSLANHESIHLLHRMLVFDPKQRITAADAITHPYLDEGRLRYHSCMCNCCYNVPNSPHRTYTAVFEPTCHEPFSYDFEADLGDISDIKEKLYKFITDYQGQDSRVPLCLNPNSMAFKTFQSVKGRKSRSQSQHTSNAAAVKSRGPNLPYGC